MMFFLVKPHAVIHKIDSPVSGKGRAFEDPYFNQVNKVQLMVEILHLDQYKNLGVDFPV